MDRKLCPIQVHRTRLGRDQRGIWFKDDGGTVYLTDDDAGSRYEYPDEARMRLEGWTETLVA